MEVFLTLDKEGLIKTEHRANKSSIESSGEKEGKDTLEYGGINFELDTFDFDKSEDSLDICGRMYSNGIYLGFISLDIPINIDLAIPIIESYMKKLGKLKTVLEATK